MNVPTATTLRIFAGIIPKEHTYLLLTNISFVQSTATTSTRGIQERNQSYSIGLERKVK